MSTIYLVFPDRATFEALLPEGLSAEHHEMSSVGHLLPFASALHICGAGTGKLYRQDAVFDPDTGECITPPTLIDGFHVNLLPTGDELPAEWAQYVVVPDSPQGRF